MIGPWFQALFAAVHDAHPGAQLSINGWVPHAGALGWIRVGFGIRPCHAPVTATRGMTIYAHVSAVTAEGRDAPGATLLAWRETDPAGTPT